MSWSLHALPILLTIAAWWGSTAVIARVVGRPQHTYRRLLGIASLLGVAGLILNISLLQTLTISSAIGAFCAALAIWGWIEITFLTGAVTGPPPAHAPRSHGLGRAIDALRAILWHELLIIATVVSVGLVTAGNDNELALLVLLLLWLMRSSAKLNLFLGVRNLGEGFFPPPLLHLLDFMQKRRMNLLMPISLLLGSAITLQCARDALEATTPYAATSATMLATLALLAVFEHLLMILPLPAEHLWRWSLANRRGVP